MGPTGFPDLGAGPQAGRRVVLPGVKATAALPPLSGAAGGGGWTFCADYFPQNMALPAVGR